jgi:hypothetical protein
MPGAAATRTSRGRSAGSGRVLDWLVSSKEPAIRRMAQRDLLDETPSDDEAAVLGGPLVSGLLAGQQPDGGFGIGPYTKWTGAHWRLVSLVELEIPPGEPRAVAALETVLAWLSGDGHRRGVPIIAGLARRCASQEGNALAAASRLGRAFDERVGILARSLVEWQWPDGGWNCDRRPEAHRSSFHESLPPVWGLHEYAAATGDADAASAARRGAELFLGHRVYRTLKDGTPMASEMLTLHYPPYWHYDVGQALLVLWRLGLAADPRAADAVELLRRRRRPDGTWRPSTTWWSAPGSTRKAEAVDWGEFASQMATLNALRILRSAERF